MVQPPIPALIIGLGGTGAMTVIRVKEQLLNTYNNELPKTVGLLALDTSVSPLSQMGQAGEVRDEGKGFGAVTFAPREFGHIGGNAEEMIKRAASGDPSQRYLTNWLLAEWYRKNLSTALYKLEDGAGQYRQLGRIALFRDVASPNSSTFVNLIRSKLNEIRNAAGAARSLPVFIIGSLAGGTGAGLFIDTAYLVRKMAASLRFEVQLRGYFLLPDAFGATIASSEVVKAKQRAYAAIRELSRMVLFEEPELGYPIVYREPSAADSPELWKDKLREKLYDLVYLIDGHRDQNPLNTVPLPLGVTPSVADSIVSFIDNAAGEYQRAYVVNLNGKMNDRRTSEGQMAFVGGAGAYSIMLPIQQIIEKWAFQLGRDALDELLAPDKNDIDSSTGLPRSLRADRNPERGITPQKEVENLLGSRNPIPDPTDPDARRQFFPTSLWPTIHKWYTDKNRNEGALAGELQNKLAQAWIDILLPGASDTDREAGRLMNQVRQYLEHTVITQVKLSDQTDPPNDPKDDHGRIHGQTQGFMDSQLGRRTTTGQREGGVLRQKLTEFSAWQANRFRNAIQAYALLQLNGQDPAKPDSGRTGKLAWFIAVLEELDLVFSTVQTAISNAVTQAGTRVQQRNATEGGWESAYKLMVSESPKTRAMPFTRSDALKAQDGYKAAAQQVFDMYRADLGREIILSLVTEMRDFVRVIKVQMEKWRRVMAMDYSSLYGRMHRGMQQIESERNSQGGIASRTYIRDDRWEKQRYDHYVIDQNAKQAALAAVQWHTKLDTGADGKPRLRVAVRFGGVELDDEMTGNWDSRNFNALISACRDIFKVARQQESVLTYLSSVQYKDNPSALARDIHSKSGALLSFDDSQTGLSERGAYLLAFQDGDRPQDITFIRNVMSELRGLYGVGDDETLAKLQHSDDRFRLTFVFMHEILPIEKIKAVQECRDSYLALQTIQRRLTHILPAEVNAVKYEDQLGRLNQGKRTFSHPVAILLEDQERFELFQALWAHRIIQVERDYLNQQGTHFVWYLVAPSKDPNQPDLAEEWWLTEPSAQPTLLEALTTFQFRDGDWGRRKHINDFKKLFDFDYIRRYLEIVRQAETDARTNAMTLAQYNKADLEPLLHQVADQYGVDHKRFRGLTRAIAERDVLIEHRKMLEDNVNGLKDQVGRINAGSGGDTVENKATLENYDLFTLSLLVVDEMIKARYDNALLLAGKQPGSAGQPPSR